MFLCKRYFCFRQKTAYETRISDWSSDVCSSDLVIVEQLLDAVLQRRGRGGATRAGALHLEEDLPLVEPAIDDVAAVIGDRGAHAGVDQIPDLFDDIGIGGIVAIARSEVRRLGKECGSTFRSRW